MHYPLFALAGIAETSFTLALSGALMPGPLLTVTVAEAARRGVRAGPLVITGYAVRLVVYHFNSALIVFLPGFQDSHNDPELIASHVFSLLETGYT